jgi:TolA-binding protein
MVKKIFFILTLLLLVSLVYAQQQSIIDRAKEKLKGIKTTDSVKISTAIAGVRGAEEKEESNLFWYGKDTVTQDELEMFKSGLDKIERGDTSSAKQTFEIFLNKYPKSVLSPEAYEILKTLKQ